MDAMIYCLKSIEMYLLLNKSAYLIYFRILLLISILTPYSCSVSKSKLKTNVLYLEASTAPDVLLNKTIEDALQSGVNKIVFKKGEHNIRGPLFSKVNFEQDLLIQFEDGANVTCDGYFINYENQSKRNLKLSKNLERGDTILYLSSIFGLQKKQIISIISKLNGETGWNYKKTDNIEIVEIYEDIGAIKINKKLNFSYTLKEDNPEIIVFPYQLIEFQNCKINFTSSHNNDNFGIKLIGINFKASKLSLISNSNPRSGRLLQLFYCNNVEIDSLNLSGVTYGLLLASCSNIYISNVMANNCQHAIVPAVWTDNLNINNIKGENFSIDAHPSFNIRIANAEIYSANDYFNCRALGVTFENCKFKSNVDFTSSSIYIGVVTLIPELEHLYFEYDVNMKNVEWVHKLNGLNGLHVHKARNFIVDSCVTHSVSIGSNCKKVEVNNSRIGQFNSNDCNFHIQNTVFDGNLQGIEPEFAISTNFSGNATIVNSTFINYSNKKSYLIGRIHSPESSITFNKCQIGGFLGLVKNFSFPVHTYNSIQFKSCDISGIAQKIPKQINNKALKANNRLQRIILDEKS